MTIPPVTPVPKTTSPTFPVLEPGPTMKPVSPPTTFRPTEVNNPPFVMCTVCSGGITVPPSTHVGQGGKTCGTLLEDRMDVEEGSAECANLKNAEPTCCPPISPSNSPISSPSFSPTSIVQTKAGKSTSSKSSKSMMSMGGTSKSMASSKSLKNDMSMSMSKGSKAADM